MFGLITLHEPPDACRDQLWRQLIPRALESLVSLIVVIARLVREVAVPQAPFLASLWPQKSIAIAIAAISAERTSS
jgi:hypothetical protein